MSALPNVVPFQLPKKPRIKEKEPPPDQRKICVVPVRAVFDKQLSHGALQALAALCAYCNRAGITWVSQTRLASELGISQQAVAKQFKQLRERGYLETIRKGFKGERTDTLRVIYDTSIDANTAIAITSTIEDTRPPEMKREQAQEVDQEGQKRIAQLISKALKKPPKKEPTMPKPGQSPTVKRMHEEIAKTKARRSKGVDNHVDNTTTIHNPQVVNEEVLHSQPNHNLEVVYNPKNTGIDIDKDKVNKGLDKVFIHKVVLHNHEIETLIADGITESQIEDSLATLLPLYRAEGIEPSHEVLIAGIKQLVADTA